MNAFLLVLGFYLSSAEPTLKEALLSTIQLSASPTTIVSSLESLKQSLQNQFMEAQGLNATQEQVCIETIPAFSLLLESTHSSIDSNTELLNRDTPELETVQEAIQNKQVEVSTYQEELQKVKQQLKDQQSNWEVQEENYSHLIEAAVGSSKLMTQLKYDETSLPYVKYQLASLESSLVKAAEEVGKQLHKNTFAGVARIAEEADSKSIEEMLGLLDNLKQNLINTKVEAQGKFEKTQKGLEEYVGTLNESIENSKSEIENLERKRERLEFSISESRKELNELQNQVDMFKEVIEDLHELCKLWRQRFATQTSQIQTQQNLLGEVLQEVSQTKLL